MTVKSNLQSEIKLVVWMVTYNHEAYIEQAIESVMMQETDFKYQLLIGEDCSTDGTRVICQKLKAKYPAKIELYLHENNRGANSNGVFMYEKCFQSDAKYIALCEGDDYWTDPLKLQKQVDFMEAHPDYGLVHTDVNHLFEINGELIEAYNATKKITIPKGYIFEKLLPVSHLVKTMTVCVNKDLLLRALNNILKYNIDLVVADLPLWLEMARLTKFHYFPDVSATYRKNISSASVFTNFEQKVDFDYKVFDIRLFFWGKYSNDQTIRQILEEDKIKLAINHEKLKEKLGIIDIRIIEYYVNKDKLPDLVDYLSNFEKNSDEDFIHSLADTFKEIIVSKNSKMDKLSYQMRVYKDSKSAFLVDKIKVVLQFFWNSKK